MSLGTLVLKGLEDGIDSLTWEEQERLKKLGDRLSSLENLAADIQPSLGGVGRIDVGNVRINKAGAFIRSGEIRMGTNVRSGPYWIGDPSGIRLYQKTNLAADYEASIRWFSIDYGDDPGDELGTFFTYHNTTYDSTWFSRLGGGDENYDSNHNNSYIETAAITKSSQSSSPNYYMGSTWAFWWSYWNASSQSDFGTSGFHRYYEVDYGNGVSFPVTFSLGYDYNSSHYFTVIYGSCWLNNLASAAPACVTGYGQIYVYGTNLYYRYGSGTAVQLDAGGSGTADKVAELSKTTSFTNNTNWNTWWEYTIPAGTLAANGNLFIDTCNYLYCNLTASVNYRLEVYDGTTTTYYPSSSGLNDGLAASTTDHDYPLELVWQNLASTSSNYMMLHNIDHGYCINTGTMSWNTASNNIRIRIEVQMNTASTSFHSNPRYARVHIGQDFANVGSLS